MDSKSSFDKIPNTRYGRLAINWAGKIPSSIAISPETNPSAAKENATGSPMIKKTTRAANIAGAINSRAGIIGLGVDTAYPM
jgi:hypothetical protein